MLKYACIYLDKQSSKYSKIMNVPDAVHSIRSLYKLLSCYQGLSVQCKIFKMECFTKRVMPEWRHASRYFSRQWRFCGTRKIWQTLQQKNKKKREKHLGVFSPRYSYIHILNERYTPKMDTIRAFFSRIGLFFTFSTKQSSPLDVRLCVWLSMH